MPYPDPDAETTVWDELARDHFKDTDFTFAVEVSKGITSYDITAYILGVENITENLYGFTDKGSSRFEYPTFTVTLKNDDGRFSVGHTNSIWNNGSTDELDGWGITFSLVENFKSTYLVPETTFDVVDAQYNDNIAIVTAVHPLQRYWARVWDMEQDSQAITWSGLYHYGPNWSI